MNRLTLDSFVLRGVFFSDRKMQLLVLSFFLIQLVFAALVFSFGEERRECVLITNMIKID